jgi:hypothetical protein
MTTGAAATRTFSTKPARSCDATSTSAALPAAF